jgi:hypothetical protein
MSASGGREDPARESSSWQSAGSVRIVSGGAHGGVGVPYAGRGSGSSGTGSANPLFAGGIVMFLLFACTAISLFDLYVLLSG